MDKNSNKNQQHGHHEHPLPQEISEQERKTASAAHKEADKDMADDAELTASSPADDLDEGESARLGENTDLIWKKPKTDFMQQFHGRPTERERKPETTRVSASASYQPQQDRRSNGDPAKFNTRSERRRIGWENDLYERQSIW